MRKKKVLRFLRLLRWHIWFLPNDIDSFKSLFNKERAFCNSISRLQSFSNDKVRNIQLNELIRSNIVASRLDIVFNTVLKTLLLKNVMLEQMELFSWTKFWKRQLWEDHNLGTFLWKTKSLESQVAHNKQITIVPTS